jgi:hypothetical protein
MPGKSRYFSGGRQPSSLAQGGYRAVFGGSSLKHQHPGCASFADRLNNDIHFVWVITSDNQISIGACEPQLVAVKDANLNGIAAARIYSPRVVSQVKGNRHLSAGGLNCLLRNRY